MPDSLATLASSAAQSALDHVLHVAGKLGPRPVGSEAEKEAARYVQSQLLRAGLRPTRQEFQAPTSEWLSFTIAAAAVAVGVGVWLLLSGSVAGAYLGALGIGFGLWEVYAKLTFGWSPLSNFVPRQTSQNVVTSVEPTEGVGRNAVVFAHLDTQRTPLLFRSHIPARRYWASI